MIHPHAFRLALVQVAMIFAIVAIAGGLAAIGCASESGDTRPTAPARHPMPAPCRDPLVAQVSP